MAEARHKVKEIKRKTIVDRLKSSALFILALIVLVCVDVVLLIVWISGVLSAKEEFQGSKAFTNPVALWCAGISLGLVAFLFLAWLYQRYAKSHRSPAHAPSTK